jgi:hypothetical protein
MVPGAHADYLQPVMAHAIYNDTDFDSPEDNEQDAISYLRPPGAEAGVIVEALQECNWTPCERAPVVLMYQEILKHDTHPRMGRWFETEVPEDFITRLEELGAQSIPERPPAKPGALRYQLFLIGMLLAFMAMAWLTGYRLPFL